MPEGYREHTPSLLLRPFVDCYWTRDLSAASSVRVLPDGCVDILFDLMAERSGERAYAVGAMSRPLVVSRARASSIVAVRFRPGGAYPFLSLPLGELRDQHVPLDDLWMGGSSFAGRASELDAAEARARALENFLIERLPRAGRPEPRIGAAVRRIELARGRLPVEALSGELGVTRQHLNRLFERHVGIGVKFFSRVVRLQAVLKRLPAGSHERVDWARTAADGGYFDQSHLVSDFKALTGLSPTAYFASR